MREILFRGKNLESEKWVYGDLMENTYIFGKNDLYCLDSYEVDKDTVGQYREMIDKNGTKIFSGDCIIDINTAKHGMYLVTDVNEEQQLYYIDTRDGWVSKTVINFSHLDLKSIEVVGNIHDNKALLRNDR